MALTHSNFEELFSAIADAIREQEGSSATIIADNFPTRIRSLTPTGTGLDTSDATATTTTILSGYTAYVNGNKIIGTYVPLDTSDAIATAADITVGITAYVKGEKIIGAMPMAENIDPDNNNYFYLDESNSIFVTAEQDENISDMGYTFAADYAINNSTKQYIPANTNVRFYMDGSNFGDASAEDVLTGKIFTSQHGFQVEGTFTLDTEISEQERLIMEIQTALQNKFGE